VQETPGEDRCEADLSQPRAPPFRSSSTTSLVRQNQPCRRRRPWLRGKLTGGVVQMYFQERRHAQNARARCAQGVVLTQSGAPGVISHTPCCGSFCTRRELPVPGQPELFAGGSCGTRRNHSFLSVPLFSLPDSARRHAHAFRLPCQTPSVSTIVHSAV
jgi:hypothetical protein